MREVPRPMEDPYEYEELPNEERLEGLENDLEELERKELPPIRPPLLAAHASSGADRITAATASARAGPLDLSASFLHQCSSSSGASTAASLSSLGLHGSFRRLGSADKGKKPLLIPFFGDSAAMRSSPRRSFLREIKDGTAVGQWGRGAMLRLARDVVEEPKRMEPGERTGTFGEILRQLAIAFDMMWGFSSLVRGGISASALYCAANPMGICRLR